MQLSQSILDSPVALFLGAGASQPLGKPTMKPFVKALAASLSNNADISSRLLRHLISQCGEDLEAILGELDSIIGLKAFRTVTEVVAATHLNITQEIASGLRSEIEYQIIREYSDLPLPRVVELYKPLFDLIFSRLVTDRQCLPVFTTNYDTAIEEFCYQNEDYELVDGFGRAGGKDVWNPGRFHGLQLKPNKRNIVLFKLHGSVDWMYVKATDAIVRNALAFHQKIDAERYRNAIIYPAVHKVATAEPFFTAYDYFGRCCERCKLLLTIGYSFRDYDALARLRSAMFFNQNLKLALLAPDAKEVLSSLPIEHHREMIMQFPFGTKEHSADLWQAISVLIGAALPAVRQAT